MFPSLTLHLYLDVCIYLCVIYMYVRVYDCVGSQRVTDPEYDEGTTVVSKGGWGLFLSSVVQRLVFLFVVFFSFNIFHFFVWNTFLYQNVMLKCIP